MPDPTEQTPADRRFERIEAAHERTAESLAYLFMIVGNIGDGTKALLTTHVLMAGTQMKCDNAIAALAAAQQKTEERMAILAATIAAGEVKRDAERDDLKDKLHVLYEVVDNWIREHGGRAKNGKPEPPPAA